MPMTVVVTRNVAPRFRGFLASCMLEIGPGVYTAPRMNRAVRERVWRVCEEWSADLGEGAIVMTWKDSSLPGGQGVLMLGEPPRDILDHEGVRLVRAPLPPSERPNGPEEVEKKEGS